MIVNETGVANLIMGNVNNDREYGSFSDCHFL